MKKKHLHTYRRDKLGDNHKIYKCIDPLCTHYIAVHLAKGKMCLCNRCEKPMIMDKRAMKMARPCCIDCVKRKDETKFKKLEEILGDLI